MKRPLGLVALVAAAALGSVVLVLLLRHARPTTEPAAMGPRANPSADEARLPDGAFDTTLDPDSHPREGVPTVAATAVPDAPAGAQADESIAIRVVMAATREPVPEIEVQVLDRRYLDAEGQLLAQVLDDDQPLLERYARRVRADEHGIARWPRAGLLDGLVVTAERAGLRGRVTLYEGSPDEVVLALAADADVRVRVVDAARAPRAGVDVALLAKDELRAHIVVLATSATDGIAILPHARARFSERADAKATVGIAGIFRDPVEVSVDLEDVPAEPIELVLPPAGRVEVLVEHADGGPAGDACVVKVERPRERGHLGTAGFWAGEFSRTQHRIAENAHASLGPVGLGMVLVVSASESGCEPVELRAMGPEASGGSVSVRLVLGRSKPVVVGRVLDPRGTPVASSSLSVYLISRYEAVDGSAYDHLGTDARGEFRYPLPTEQLRPSTWELALTLEPDSGPRHSATVELPGDLPPGDHFVGDLVLAETPLLVAGEVVDEEGRPVVGAAVDCSLHDFFDDTRTGYSNSSVLDAEARTGSDGRFEIRARAPVSEIFLDVRHADFLEVKDLETFAGASELRIVLRGQGSVAGTVLLEDEIETADGFQLVLLSPSIEPRDSPKGRLTGREFQFRRVPPGTYAFECRYWPDQRELARIENVVVVAGETSRDPRLDPLDLRGRLHVLRIRVVDEDGRALPAVGIARRLGGAIDYSPPHWEQSGKEILALSTTTERLDLRVEAIGKRSVELLGVDGDREVVLRPGLAVRIVLASNELRLPGGVTAKFSLRPEPIQSGAVAVFEALLDERGGADLLVGRAGLYRLRVVLELPGGAAAGVKGGDELLVEVRELDAPQDATVAIDPKAWHEALARIGFE